MFVVGGAGCIDSQGGGVCLYGRMGFRDAAWRRYTNFRKRLQNARRQRHSQLHPHADAMSAQFNRGIGFFVVGVIDPATRVTGMTIALVFMSRRATEGSSRAGLQGLSRRCNQERSKVMLRSTPAVAAAIQI